MGLLLGAYGCIGSCLGSVLGGIIMQNPLNNILFETVCNLITGIIMWYVWHWGSVSHRIHFKKFINYVKYFALMTFSSALCGITSFIFFEDGDFMPVFISFLSMGVLIGIPIDVIVNGVLCLDTVLPDEVVRLHDIEGDLPSDDESFVMFTQKLEAFSESKCFDIQRTFELENTFEEIYLRIRKVAPDESLHVVIDYDDTLSIRIYYKGSGINPLKKTEDEDDLDICGLKLIESRALRATHSHSSSTDLVHVVV